MPWEALVSRFVVSVAATSAASAIFAWILSWSWHNLQDRVKAVFTLLAYMLMVTVIGLSMVNIFLAEQEASLRQSLAYLGIAVILWVCSVVPALIYVGRFKMPDLSGAECLPVRD